MCKGQSVQISNEFAASQPASWHHNFLGVMISMTPGVSPPVPAHIELMSITTRIHHDWNAWNLLLKHMHIHTRSHRSHLVSPACPPHSSVLPQRLQNDEKEKREKKIINVKIAFLYV